jgi:hypothetical protein
VRVIRQQHANAAPVFARRIQNNAVAQGARESPHKLRGRRHKLARGSLALAQQRHEHVRSKQPAPVRLVRSAGVLGDVLPQQSLQARVRCVAARARPAGGALR